MSTLDSFDKYDTHVDPCPRCGSYVDGYEINPEYVRSNPEAVSSLRDPSCPRETDPEADCTCTVVINPAPNPMRDKFVPVASWVTLTPCGHIFEQSELSDWKVTRTVKAGWHEKQLEKLLADAAKHGVDLKVSRK